MTGKQTVSLPAVKLSFLPQRGLGAEVALAEGMGRGEPRSPRLDCASGFP